MIGLGSNRLSVCRRGGMSVTQAGRGGMEWLAGGRGPSWASPYSAQATAALKAQFSLEQWATIRDYGFAHPEIVGYMNAYAPEDAKIAYSLVPTLGVIRYVSGAIGFGFYKIRGGGDTIYLNNFNLELDAMVISINNAANWPATLGLFAYVDGVRTGPGFQIQAPGTTDTYRIVVGNANVLANGVTMPKNIKLTYGISRALNGTNRVWFGTNYWTNQETFAGTTYDICICRPEMTSNIYEARLTVGEELHRFVPTIKNGTIILVDGSGLELVQIEGSSGTISETPAS